MALIPLYEAKTYLRVDSSDEDALIGILLSSAEQMCKDVGRLSEDQWETVNAADRDAENGVQPTRELEALRSTCRVAILYALGYLYEHRDEADHHQLMLTLRSILFAVREGLKEYATLASTEVKKAVRKSAKTVKDQISSNAPSRTGAYKESWVATKQSESSQSLQMVVHSKNRYQLAHLLEKGHAKRGGGRVAARPHIAPAEQAGIELLQSLIEKALK